MLGKNFSVFFYLKKPKKYIEGAMPIYMRITVDGDRKELCTSRKCKPTEWLEDLECSDGKSEVSKELNAHLGILKMKVFEGRRLLMENNKEVTAEALKNVLTGREEKGRMVLEIFQKHNDQMEALVNKDFAPGTLERYKTSISHTRAFIKWKYHVEDLPISKLNFEFATEYEFWLKTVQKCCHNTSIKYISNFKKIVNHCIRNGWLARDPFLGYKMSKKEVDVNPLTKEEIQAIREKEFLTERLGQVRDIFLFCCYTGLAYADVFKLKRSEIGIGVDGGKWIFTHRKKTESASRIPILPEALAIMNKYDDHPQCVNKDRVLPVLTNQKMNEYLKEIGDKCGITKKFTTHIARHTFATTVTLGNGVPIETVSKMLGHKNLKTTQHYAKIIDKKVSDDMLALKQKLQAV
ncbi:MAG: site-specific integrase [Sediminibacterium magnilacihabitans]|jgi:site-specific recombinase XerD|nr:site-specific integrase [Sediminibacterium magnilacihabitans]PQV59881.1 site-specific recombinase XerD [Sediminibacterium magnilacihabitans]